MIPSFEGLYLDFAGPDDPIQLDELQMDMHSHGAWQWVPVYPTASRLQPETFGCGMNSGSDSDSGYSSGNQHQLHL